MKTIIVGNGVAGLTAAQELRKLSPNLAIDIFTDEACLDYSRPRLPDFIAGEIEQTALFMHSQAWYDSKQFSVHVNATVFSLNPAEKTVLVRENGVEIIYSYDTLILVTGAQANRPSIEGIHLPHVFALRTFADAQNILKHIEKNTESVAVIGGGLLGLEAARALKERGVKTVNVVEVASRLLPRQLDETGSKLLQKQLEQKGLSFITACAVEKVTDSAIVLKDGRTIAAQTVLLSMGVHSTTETAKNCGIIINRGISVNAKMQTSVPAIFAAGDCAEFDGIVWGIIPSALEQGAVAAHFAWAHMSTDPVNFAEYTQTIPKTQLKVAGIEAVTSGKAVLTEEERTSGLYCEHAKTSDTRYEKLVTQQTENDITVLCGAILYGSRAHAIEVNRLLNKPITQAQIDGLLGF